MIKLVISEKMAVYKKNREFGVCLFVNMFSNRRQEKVA
jgi:hypothetical protein